MSIEAGRNVKELGLENNLIDLIAENPKFAMSKEEIMLHMKPEEYIGRCVQQVEEFIENDIRPAIAPFVQELEHEATALKV